MLITYTGDDGRGVVKKDFRGPRSRGLVCELGHQLAQGRRELCRREKREMPFLLASWIYGFGNRSDVTSAQGEGIYWAFPLMDDTCRLNPRTATTNQAAMGQLTSFNILASSLRILSFLSRSLGLSRNRPRRQHDLHITPDIPKMWVEPADKRPGLSFYTVSLKFQTAGVTVLIGNLQNIFLTSCGYPCPTKKKHFKHHPIIHWASKWAGIQDPGEVSVREASDSWSLKWSK